MSVNSTKKNTTWRIIFLYMYLEKTIGQEYFKTYPLQGGSSTTEEERYLKPEPLVLKDLTNNVSPIAATRVYWPFERAPPPDPNSQNSLISPNAYEQPQTILTPFKNSFSSQIQGEQDSSDSNINNNPITIVKRRRPSMRRPQTILLEQESTNLPEPIGIPLHSSGPPPYTNFLQIPDRIHRPNYFDPSGINYAPTFNNYIPITRFHHEMNPGRGEYNVAFETANGISQQESGYLKRIPVYNFETGRYEDGAANVKSGFVSWTSPEGIPFSFSYTADENGFRPVGDHIASEQYATQKVVPSFISDSDLNSYKPVIPYNPIQNYQ